MAAVPGVTRRLRDAVRDSKIRKDIPSKPYQKFDSFATKVDREDQDSDGWRHHLYYGHHQVGRDFPRATQDGVAAAGFNLNSIEREGHQVIGFASSFDEVECWFRFYMEKEAPFLGVYRRNTESESIITRFKRNLPVFDGFWHIKDLLGWIAAFDDFFEEIRPPKHIKCKIVWSKMIGRAYYWWKQLQQERNELGKREITSWAVMKDMILNRFSPTTCSTKYLIQSYNSNSSKAGNAREGDDGNNKSSSSGEGSVEEPKGVLGLKSTTGSTEFMVRLNEKENASKEIRREADLSVFERKVDMEIQVVRVVREVRMKSANIPPVLFLGTIDQNRALRQQSKENRCDTRAKTLEVGSEVRSVSVEEKMELSCQLGDLQTMLPKMLVDDMVRKCISLTVIRGSESGHATKVDKVEDVKNQPQTHLKPKDIKFHIGMTLMFNFDPDDKWRNGTKTNVKHGGSLRILHTDENGIFHMPNAMNTSMGMAAEFDNMFLEAYKEMITKLLINELVTFMFDPGGEYQQELNASVGQRQYEVVIITEKHQWNMFGANLGQNHVISSELGLCREVDFATCNSIQDKHLYLLISASNSSLTGVVLIQFDPGGVQRRMETGNSEIVLCDQFIMITGPADVLHLMKEGHSICVLLRIVLIPSAGFVRAQQMYMSFVFCSTGAVKKGITQARVPQYFDLLVFGEVVQMLAVDVQQPLEMKLIFHVLLSLEPGGITPPFKCWKHTSSIMKEFHMVNFFHMLFETSQINVSPKEPTDFAKNATSLFMGTSIKWQTTLNQQSQIVPLSFDSGGYSLRKMHSGNPLLFLSCSLLVINTRKGLGGLIYSYVKPAMNSGLMYQLKVHEFDAADNSFMYLKMFLEPTSTFDSLLSSTEIDSTNQFQSMCVSNGSIDSMFRNWFASMLVGMLVLCKYVLVTYAIRKHVSFVFDPGGILYPIGMWITHLCPRIKTLMETKSYIAILLFWLSRIELPMLSSSSLFSESIRCCILMVDCTFTFEGGTCGLGKMDEVEALCGFVQWEDAVHEYFELSQKYSLLANGGFKDDNVLNERWLCSLRSGWSMEERTLEEKFKVVS